MIIHKNETMLLIRTRAPYLSRQRDAHELHHTELSMDSHSFSLKPTTVLLLLLLLLSCFFNNTSAKSKHSRSTSHRRHHVHSHSSASNARLERAYIALQAWKKVIYSDPRNFTFNWVGPNVCNYSGIYCTAASDDPKIKVVAGIDLNHADIAGLLPKELGLLTDLALLHVNSNRFCGIIPDAISNLVLLYELDLSSNRFVGSFPAVVLSLPTLKYLDLRYNEFEGPLPPELFQKSLDAIFVNDNNFTSGIPSLGGSTASVIVIANNNFQGCLPATISNLADTLEELVIINANLTGCLPPEVGYLYNLRLLDVSHNQIVGPIPYSLAGLAHLEVLNLAYNSMAGLVPEGVCILPSLSNFTVSYNFFCEEQGRCVNLTSRGVAFDDRHNCLPQKPAQKSAEECTPVIEHPVDCFELCCEEDGGFGSGWGAFPFTPPPLVPAPPLFPPSIAPSKG